MLTALTLLFAPEDRHQLTVQNHCGAARVHMGGCCLTSHPNQHQSSAVVLLQQSANWSAMIKRSTTTLNAAALEPACLPRYCGRRRVGLRGAPTICHGFEAAARIDAQFKPICSFIMIAGKLQCRPSQPPLLARLLDVLVNRMRDENLTRNTSLNMRIIVGDGERPPQARAPPSRFSVMSATVTNFLNRITKVPNRTPKHLQPANFPAAASGSSVGRANWNKRQRCFCDSPVATGGKIPGRNLGVSRIRIPGGITITASVSRDFTARTRFTVWSVHSQSFQLPLLRGKLLSLGLLWPV